MQNREGKPIKPDEKIPAALLKLMGEKRVKKLEEQGEIADQPKSATYVIAARNTQAALKKSLKELAEAEKDKESLVDEITKLKVENERLKDENKTLKNAVKERDKALKDLEKTEKDLETLKEGYAVLSDQLKEAKKGGDEGG